MFISHDPLMTLTVLGKVNLGHLIQKACTMSLKGKTSRDGIMDIMLKILKTKLTPDVILTLPLVIPTLPWGYVHVE